jgi:DNA-binding CsgD family transcriptional regulator
MYLNLQVKKFVDEFELTNQLTPRQVTILKLIHDGYNNRQIASELSYSISLIRQETMRIYAKLGVNGRNELKALANKIN